ncbi:MAG: hypothetical protein IJA30_04130 [Bacilli bacterium]|nr:hypothetical protein [Bacilli bacterium]
MDKTIKRGYKAFNADLTNRYGVPFIEGGSYSVTGPAVFGNQGNGFHFCERLEDTLRYFNAMDEDIKIALVEGSGEMVEANDEYYGYYDMFSATELKVIRVLSRSEIVDMFGSAPGFRTVRFVQGFKLTDAEKAWLKFKHIDNTDVLKAIDYYQDGDKEAYSPEKAIVYMKRAREYYNSI